MTNASRPHGSQKIIIIFFSFLLVMFNTGMKSASILHF